MKNKLQAKGITMEFLLDFIEFVIVLFFIALGWSSSLSFLKLGSSTYWFVCLLTSAYAILLLIKFYRKYWHLVSH